MGAKSLIRPASSLYDEDFVAWTAQTARLLRVGRFDQIDTEQLAEEIEEIGKSNQRELESRLTAILVHLLKRSGSWQSSLITQRAEVLKLLKQSPSLRRTLPNAVDEVYPTAVRKAAAETGLSAKVLRPDCPFSMEQILDQDFLPEP